MIAPSIVKGSRSFAPNLVQMFGAGRQKTAEDQLYLLGEELKTKKCPYRPCPKS